MPNQNDNEQPARAGTAAVADPTPWGLEANARKITIVCPDGLPDLLLTREILRHEPRTPEMVAAVVARQHAVLRWGGPRVEVFLSPSSLIGLGCTTEALARLYQHLFGLARYGGVTFRFVDFLLYPDLRPKALLTVVEPETGDPVVPLDGEVVMPCLEQDRHRLAELDVLAWSAHQSLTYLAEFTVPDPLDSRAEALALHQALGLTD